MEHTICNNCKSGISLDDKFCRKCGVPLVQPQIHSIDKSKNFDDEPTLSSCPKCASQNISRIVFCNMSGFQFYKKQIQLKTIMVKGELDLEFDSFRWHCNDCKFEYGKFSDVFQKLKKSCPCCNFPKLLPDSPFCTECSFKLIQGPYLEAVPLGGFSKLDVENLFNNIQEGFPEFEADQNEDIVLSYNAVLQLPDNTRIELDEKTRVIGRTELLEYSSSDPKEFDPTIISKQHFTIFNQDGIFYIEDDKTSVQEKPSKNKTYLNGFDITANGPKKLKLGDFINLANTLELRFFVKDELGYEWYDGKTDPAAEELVRQGSDLRHELKYDESLRCLDESLRIEPNFIKALESRAVTLRDLGRYDDAIACCDKIIEIDPTYVFGMIQKCTEMYYAGKYSSDSSYLHQALLWLNEELEKDPTVEYLHGTKADVLMELGQVKEALE